MSERAREFVENWVSENIHPTGCKPEGDQSPHPCSGLGVHATG
jgi:hypothetical protein